MDISQPYTAVIPSLEGEALIVLARTTRPLTGTEVATISQRGSRPGIQLALHRLAEQGIVDVADAGRRAQVYTLNRDHVAAPAVEILANLRSELQLRIRTAIESWPIQPVHASIFGSAARGDGDTASDIDLFVVRPNQTDENDSGWRNQLDSLAERIYRWSGNRAGISEVSQRELTRLRREQPPITTELRSDAVTIVGRRPAELLKARG